MKKYQLKCQDFRLQNAKLTLYETKKAIVGIQWLLFFYQLITNLLVIEYSLDSQRYNLSV
jgi:hypothetical protein